MHYHIIVRLEKEDIDMVKGVLDSGLPNIEITVEDTTNDELFCKWLRVQVLELLRAVQVFKEPS